MTLEGEIKQLEEQVQNDLNDISMEERIGDHVSDIRLIFGR